MSFNKVVIVGNITRDIELKSFKSGHSYTRFTVAVSRKHTGKDGNTIEETAFVDVDAFGKQAETIKSYFGKGKPILVEGRLKTDTWEDKNTGEKRSRLGVVLESFAFVGGGEKTQKSGEATGNTRRDPTPPPNNTDVDEDIPF